MAKITTAEATDQIVKPCALADMCVSADMVYGVAELEGQWFRIEVKRIDLDEVRELFPSAVDD